MSAPTTPRVEENFIVLIEDRDSYEYPELHLAQGTYEEVMRAVEDYVQAHERYFVFRIAREDVYTDGHQFDTSKSAKLMVKAPMRLKRVAQAIGTRDPLKFFDGMVLAVRRDDQSSEQRAFYLKRLMERLEQELQSLNKQLEVEGAQPCQTT